MRSIAGLGLILLLVVCRAAAAADAPATPKVPDGFAINTFAAAPDIKSPASICVSPDGKLFVGEDEYNTQPKREPGLARVKLCIDTNGDGKADKFTVFADKLNAPQGITYVGDTLYVMHAPLLTAFRDSNGDGVADSRVDLVTGLGPAPEGLVHHIPSGLRMGIDGWLYISIGDKGIVKATGRDGRMVSLWGGGVVRVRPDGTMMELFSAHTRNTFDVSLDPYLDAFTRDNTNDGDGWDSRLTQMQRDGEYGYPRLFKHFADEMIDCVAAYGSGSATGSMYLHEPGFPKDYGDSLYASDWARGILYRHVLARKGAGFDAKQEEFIKDIRPTDLDVDVNQHLFVADWGRRDWGNVGAVGSVYRVQPTTRPVDLKPYPDLKSSDNEQLLAFLASPSQVVRVNAQQELLHRGPSPRTSAALTAIAMKRTTELYARVAALFTLKQLDGDAANGTFATLASLPDLREFALRALADRDDEVFGVNTNLFVQGLRDSNPRVRVQAAIGLGHLVHPELATYLVPVTADPDPLVRHAAMTSLRRLRAENVCLAALSDFSQPQVVSGAMRVLREFHTDATVNAVAQVFATAPTPALRQDAIKTLTQLYHVETKWDGKWWTPRPDTRGPYYVHEPWAQSERVANVLIGAIDDRDPPTAKMALQYIGFVEMKEAVPRLTSLIASGGPLHDDAASTLIAIKSRSPEALAALERVVLGENFNPDVRASAAQAISALDPAKSQPILVRIIAKLDAAPKIPNGLLDKVSDALASKPTPPDKVTAIMPLLSAIKPPIRNAAATTLMRSADANVREQVKRTWQGTDPVRVEALLAAVPRLPAETSAPFAEAIHALLKSPRETTRQLATIALGHIGDASAVKDLVQLASRDRDPLPAVSALAGIDPAKTADDQVLVIATLLVDNSAKVQKENQDTYARLVGAAQKFIADPRVPAPKATALRSKLLEPGVITQYMKTDALPAPAGKQSFDAVFPPEQSPAGPFGAFSVNGKSIDWKPLTVTDPKGKQALEMPDNSVVYLSATYPCTAAGSGWLTTGSDDGLQVWVNAAKVISKNDDRGLLPDVDRAAVALKPGANSLLFKVNNKSGVGGIQARLRTKVVEFDPDEMVRVAHAIKGTPARGREVFTTVVGCVKCHTTDRHDEPKGPFLGDVGGKFDAKYIVESIMKPSAKIAQGFDSVNIVVKGQGDYTGFVTKETADEVQVRDLTGKVTVVQKGSITKRAVIPGSMMPQGLVDNLSLDDFASLLTYLESMKK